MIPSHALPQPLAVPGDRWAFGHLNLRISSRLDRVQ